MQLVLLQGPVVQVKGRAVMPAGVDERWADYARRQIAKYCVLIVADPLNLTQLTTKLEDVSLLKTRGGAGAGGNMVIMFDANLFGESITAPHILKAPLQQQIITKLWKAIMATRKEPDQTSLLPTGDVVVITDVGA